MPIRPRAVLAFLVSSMKTSACYKIGYILKPHGLKGEVTVVLDPGFPLDFNDIKTVWIERANRLLPYFVQSASVRDTRAFVKFEDVDTPEDARTLSRGSLYLPKESRPKSGKGSFYDDEIIGFEVTDLQTGTLGHVTGVTNAGANRLLTMPYRGKDLLIPVNGPFITSVNKSTKTITVSLPEGFFDL